jgi:putative sterol carrier protein
MEFLEEIAAKLKDAITSRLVPARSLKINLKGLGVIVATPSSVSTEDGAADTAITISRADFENLVAGKLSPQLAYLQGKIKIEGDPTAALQWLPVIQGKPA